MMDVYRVLLLERFGRLEDLEQERYRNPRRRR